MFSQGFIENSVTLLITAGLTGVLVPFIFRLIDERRNREQKIFEAELSRQASIIDAQIKLLEDLSNLLWEYQLLLIAVPYFRQFPHQNLYVSSLNAYNENSGRLLSRIRAEISKSLRLTPHSVYEDLKELYYKELLAVDLRLTVLSESDMREEDKTTAWRELNYYAVYELAQIVDDVIDMLASELNLKAQAPKPFPQKER